jgi:hypothetical protein
MEARIYPVLCANSSMLISFDSKCKGARAGNSICKSLQNIELKLTGPNGCLWGKARAKYYGVTPDQPIPK